MRQSLGLGVPAKVQGMVGQPVQAGGGRSETDQRRAVWPGRIAGLKNAVRFVRYAVSADNLRNRSRALPPASGGAHLYATFAADSAARCGKRLPCIHADTSERR